MTHTIEICEAILNGIKHLEEERCFGGRTELHQANLKQRIALLGGNELAAAYWSEVAAACRKLEQRIAQTHIIITAIAD